MSRLHRLVLGVVVLALLVPAHARAQGVRITPSPIAADAPTARQALALAELLLAGDRQKVEAFLRTNGAESLTGSEGFASILTAAIDDLRSGSRVIVGQDGFGNERNAGVMVQLAPARGQRLERGLVVRMEPAAPHRITNFRVQPLMVQKDAPN